MNAPPWCEHSTSIGGLSWLGSSASAGKMCQISSTARMVENTQPQYHPNHVSGPCHGLLDDMMNKLTAAGI